MYLAVFFRPNRLPTGEHWESIAREKGITFEFPADFDPRQYFVERDTEDGGHAPVAVRLDGVNCRLQLCVYTLDSDDFLEEDDRMHAREGDLGVSFEWEASHRPNAIASQLAAATLALAADGAVEWDSVKGGWCRGAHAWKTISNAAVRQIRSFAKSEAAKARISVANLFGPPKTVTLTAKGLIRCPRCEWTFEPGATWCFEGAVHLRCGQRIDNSADAD